MDNKYDSEFNYAVFEAVMIAYIIQVLICLILYSLFDSESVGLNYFGFILLVILGGIVPYVLKSKSEKTVETDDIDEELWWKFTIAESVALFLTFLLIMCAESTFSYIFCSVVASIIYCAGAYLKCQKLPKNLSTKDRVKLILPQGLYAFGGIIIVAIIAGIIFALFGGNGKRKK